MKCVEWKKYMSKAVSIKEKGYNLTNPSQMVGLANVLKNHILTHKLYTTIVGKNYAHVEGWQFAGGMMGLFPIVREVNDISKGTEYRWSATVEIINIKTGAIVGRGFAICSNKENKKKSFDEYAVISMAQTRAIGKAYRNMLGWVMKLAGYEGTPSEEMVKVGDKAPAPSVPQEEKVSGPDGVPTATCKICADPITDQEYAYSKKMFNKALCREHQKEAKRK